MREPSVWLTGRSTEDFPCFRLHFGRFSLDFEANRTDNLDVVFIRLIYSPPDTPKGLGRGFVFWGIPERVGDAC
jgi:hypothetical protein